MSLAIELIVVGLLLPATIAAFIVWGALRFDTARRAERYALPCGVAAGFIAAYVVVFKWAALSPDRHWQWLPYLAAAAALVGPARASPSRLGWLRWTVFLVLAASTAFFLVPKWETLRPARPASIAILALYLALLMAGVDRLPKRLSTAWLLATLALTGLALAGVLADGSVRYGQVAGMGAAAFAGSWLVVAVGRRSSAFECRSIAPLYSVLIGGMAYVGCVEPEEPLWWLLLIPAVPLVVGLTTRFIRPYRASAGSAQ
jgi:hypothetical protein